MSNVFSTVVLIGDTVKWSELVIKDSSTTIIRILISIFTHRKKHYLAQNKVEERSSSGTNGRLYLTRCKQHKRDERNRHIKMVNWSTCFSFSLEHISFRHCITGECLDPRCSSERNFPSSSNETSVSMYGSH